MSDCCSTGCDVHNTAPRRYTCPLNHREYRQVSTKTVLHNLRQPWTQKLDQHSFYFCDDPDCEVVYFDQGDYVIYTNELRSDVGAKQKSAEATLCYCFDITFEQASVNPGLKNYVVEMTGKQMCECATRNPSGKCCLKDFP